MPNPKGHEESIKDSRFKAVWQSGPTRTIRVPIALTDATLEYARQLDRGIEPRDTSEMFDCRTDVVMTEPRDTMVKLDYSTHNKVDTIVAQAHDTAKMHAELESIRANYDVLLETSARITTKLREEVHKLRRCWIQVWIQDFSIAIRLLEGEFCDFKRKVNSYRESAMPKLRSALELPEASVLLNRLKAKRKKATASLADIEAILEILEE